MLLIAAMLLSILTVAPFTAVAVDTADSVGASVTTSERDDAIVPESDNFEAIIGATEDTSCSCTDTLCGSSTVLTDYSVVGGQADIPTDATLYNGNYYKIFYEAIDWEDAKQKCLEYGGHLATITDSNEQGFIESLNSNGRKLWIGGYKDSGQWKWVTGENFEQYTHWDDGEPNNSSNVISNENCVSVWPYYWNDLNNKSREQSGYICEWECHPTGLQLNRSYVELELGKEFQLIATVVPDNATDKSVKWWSGDEDIATVSNTGLVKAKGSRLTNSTATIYAKTSNGITKSCTIKVVVYPKSISFQTDSLEMTVGESKTLEVTYDPSYTNVRDLTWKSTDPSIATVDSSGKVTAKKAGETTVTAQTTNGKGCYCHVVVKEKTYAQTYGWCLSNNEESYGYDKLEHDKNGNPKHPIALRNLISQYGYNIPSYAYAELQQLCHSSWTGYCFGLSILSLAQYYGKVDLKPYFSQSGEYLYDFGYEKIYTDASGHDCFSIEGNSKAIDLIEVAHTYQYSPTFSTCRVFNFDDHYANLLSFLNSDEAHPIMVNLGDGISGHTMVITTDEKPDLISGTTDWYYLPLYDPNAPANSDKLKNPESYYTRDDTFLAVNTTTTEWSYYCNGNEIYNGNFRTLGFANIKFYDISKLSSHFLTNRLPSPNSVLNLFADNIKIMGNNNQVLLQVKDGQITDLDEGCEISVMSSVTDSGENRIFIFSTEEEKLKIKTDGAEIFSSTPDYMFIAKTDSDSTIEYDSSKGVIQSRSSGGNAVIAVQELSSEQCVMLSDASAQSKMSARVQNDTVEICSENRDITVNSSNIAEEKTNISDHQLYAGDVNSDSLLNMKDIVLLQQSLNGWDVSINEYASDVNNDGTINMKDIVLIQQALNGWDVVLK